MRRKATLGGRRVQTVASAPAPVDLRKHLVDLRKHRVDLRKRRVDLRKRRIRVRPPTLRPTLLTRGTRAVRGWSRRPAGRIVVPGVLMFLLVALMAVAGATLPRAAGTDRPPAGPAKSGDGESADPEESAPDADAGLPPLDPSAGPDDPADPAGGPSEELTAWAAPIAVTTNIPVVALQAYASAELTVAQSKPGCNLRWTTLAGIGSVESNHGRTGGATLNNDGRVTPPIIGPALDGQGGRRSIPDTDGGRVDNDRVWDRAVGPMQFIPNTWVRYATDGDGDGEADPHNIYDAAVAAGNYLCADGRNLAVATDWRAAILAYNNVDTYVQKVYNEANTYGTRSRL